MDQGKHYRILSIFFSDTITMHCCNVIKRASGMCNKAVDNNISVKRTNSEDLEKSIASLLTVINLAQEMGVINGQNIVKLVEKQTDGCRKSLDEFIDRLENYEPPVRDV